MINLLSFSSTTVILGLMLVLHLTACGDGTPNDPSADPAAASTTSTEDPKTLLGQLDQAIEQEPLNGDLYYQRAKLYYDRESFDEAIADMAQAIQIDSVNADFHHLLADIFLDYYKSRQALMTMERAARLHPERIPTLLKLSEFQHILRQHDASFKTLDQILKLDPQNAEAYFMMGLNLREIDKENRAIDAFQTAVEIDPDLKDAWVLLGDLFSKQDNPIALRYYDNAILLDSTSIDYIYAKANYLHQRGELSEASELYRKILRLDPQNADAYYNMGLVYMEQDSLQRGAEHFELATQTDPLFVKAYFYRGLAAEEMGDLAAAKGFYEQTLKLQPDFERARDALAALK